MQIYRKSEFTGLNIALALANTPVRSIKFLHDFFPGADPNLVFESPPPIDVDDLLPDEFFNWNEIGIK
jgi:hypothetical protein